MLRFILKYHQVKIVIKNRYSLYCTIKSTVNGLYFIMLILYIFYATLKYVKSVLVWLFNFIETRHRHTDEAISLHLLN